MPTDVLVRRSAGTPDITTDPDGNIYIVYGDTVPNYLHCVQSTDGGSTWSPPTRVNDNANGMTGSARIASDSSGNLLCAWNAGHLDNLHIFSSVSTDRGATWNPRVRVDEDTTNEGCAQADVFIQPGTNHYLVAAEVPYQSGNNVGTGCYLYRSTDMGQTFQPGVRLDSLESSWHPHVVADAQHVICDYTGGQTEARTLYTQPDTWGVRYLVGYSYTNGAKLAMSADGRVHTALMVHDSERPYHTYYAFSPDHGVSWSAPELISDDTTEDEWDPDIGADSVGNVYVVWKDRRSGHWRIWFATNNPAAIAEQPPQQPVGVQPSATVVRNVLFLPEATRHKTQAASSLLDIGGRKVLDLKPGANDVRYLAPGVYFVREEPQAASSKPQAVRKVIVTR